MAKERNLNKINNPSFPLIPSPLFHFVSAASPFTSFLFSPRKSPRSNSHHHHHHHHQSRPITFPTAAVSLFLCSLLISLTILGAHFLSLIPDDSSSCSLSFPSTVASASSLFVSLSSSSNHVRGDGIGMAESVTLPLPVRNPGLNVSDVEREFWEQPEGGGYKPCLYFTTEYRKASATISKEKRRFLVVVVAGGLNQQRNQIVDAVVIARILEASLVVPILQVNFVWEDESEFSEVFDLEHFKRILRPDVRIVSSLPSTHLRSRQSIQNQIPHDVSPHWLRTKFSRKMNEEGFVVLKGIDSRLSKNLPIDLQKLRCKVAFHALRFAPPIQEVGDRLARRMWVEGPYIALHLRLERDVWVRSGCLTGLGEEYDRIIHKARESEPDYLTGRLNMSHIQRRLSGLCPLNALEVARLLKALGAPEGARIYVAGGVPFGGSTALKPLVEKFPNIINKEMLSKEGELLPYSGKSSALAAIDYIVSLSSNVFLPSHGGNMGRLMQGHRAYVGHRKYIKPNKPAMVRLFEESAIGEAEVGRMMRKLHRRSMGQPEIRTKKGDRDVIAYPVPECMCKNRDAIF
ncbi:O-fucosyltransferase 37 [Linum perenne]